MPVHVRFWDDVKRPADLGLARLLRLWRHTPELRAESEAAYKSYDGGDFIDIGAFHGWYAVLLSPKARVGTSFLMVEPDPEALPTLLRTLSTLARLFPHVRYVALPRAAGDGSCVEITYPYGPEGHPRFASYEGTDAERSLTLDQLAEGLGLRPSFVKVDVEGAEYFVVRGAHRVFSEASPTVMLEIHPLWQPEGVSPAEVAAPLREAGYRGRALSTTELAVRELWERP